MNHTLSDSQLEEMIKSAVNSSGPLPPDEKFSQLISALRELQERRKADSEPVAIVEPSDYVTAAQLVGEGPARKAVHELYEGDLRIGDKLYRHAQPAPVVPEEMPKGLAGQIVSLLAHNIGDKLLAQKIWNACRSTMLSGGES